VSRLPIRSAAFTQTVSFQVLEHLPTGECRRQAFLEARRVLAPGGRLVVTVYNWSQTKKSQSRLGIGNNTAKEGLHEIDGLPVYFYNFEKPELDVLLKAAGFEVQSIRGIQIQLKGLGRLGYVSIPIDRFLSWTRLGPRYGHLLLGQGKAV
jgi:SAM-dependent methyltransferase